MRRAVEAAGISNATILNARSEELAAGERREAYDAVTARAVGRLSTLAELASPLLREGGVLVAWKGRRDPEEEQQLARAAEALAMRPEAILDVGDRAGSQHRHLHVLRKLARPQATCRAAPAWPRSAPEGRGGPGPLGRADTRIAGSLDPRLPNEGHRPSPTRLRV